ncbi:MAG: asparagine synthetase B, partial [Myxococcota bacterium]|nr:asparagine synthetase B [Myxococcota bacterium]
MCGIAGIVDPNRPAAAHAAPLDRMIAALAHRGPDGMGRLIESPLALAHSRLAIVDRERQGPDQPWQSYDHRYVLLFNGEIYNHEELRSRLDYPFRTRSDAEAVLAACATWGPVALTALNGMFALFFWDRHLHTGFLGRDALGVKPLLYRRQGEALWFASEAKALV